MAVAGALVLVAPDVRLAAGFARNDVASFDWSVPERFGQHGMIGVPLPVRESDQTMRILNPEGTYGGLAPAGWPADFNACATPGARFVWRVNGEIAQDVATCGPTRITFPREGLYRVDLTVFTAAGGLLQGSQDVNIQDWLIIAMGDSYGSGEGNPNETVNPNDLVSLDIARLAAEQAEDAYRDAANRLAEAQAEVDAARQELAAARADYDEIVEAFNDWVRATQELADAQAELNSANAALASASAAVAAALANVVFQCAQFWDPAGCAAAEAQYDHALQVEANARHRRDVAVDRRNAAAAALAQASLRVPAEGFEYVMGVIAARINVLEARVNQLVVTLETVRDLFTAARNTLDAAFDALRQKVEGLATWQDTAVVPNDGIPFKYSQCHQGMASGQAQAARLIEQSDPKTSVTFIHLSCTGATVAEGILGAYDGVSPKPEEFGPREPQLIVAKRMSTGREVDALVTSIGGNDIGFSKIMEYCIALEPCFNEVNANAYLTDQVIADTCATLGVGLPVDFGPASRAICRQWLRTLREKAVISVPDRVNESFANLPGLYRDVQDQIRINWPDLPADRMFLTEYPMVSRDERAGMCHDDGDITRNLPGLSAGEFYWAEQSVGYRLNQVIRGQAQALGWTPVTGIEKTAGLHGYCSAQNWIVRIIDTFVRQGTYWGVAHPNADGHQSYARAISTSLRKKFYPDGQARVAR
jgi:multidrug efflux pump subunit AcrA (membrane-fusion protein)